MASEKALTPAQLAAKLVELRARFIPQKADLLNMAMLLQPGFDISEVERRVVIMRKLAEDYNYFYNELFRAAGSEEELIRMLRAAGGREYIP